MGKNKYTAQQMVEALEETKGMITVAARRLGCAPNTVRRYIRLYATVADAQREARENLGDQVELTLATMALGVRDPQTGEYTREPSITALIFLAKTQFKERGYTERHDFTGKVKHEDWRDKAIELIRAKEVSYKALEHEFGSDLATELFRTAGVPVEAGESARGDAAVD